MRMKKILLGAFVVILFLTVATSIDFSSDKEYDSEIEDELDAIRDLNEANAPYLKTFEQQYGAEEGENESLENELEEEQEEELEELDEEVVDEMKEEWQERSLITRVTNMLRSLEKEHGITSTSKSGHCSSIRVHVNTKHKCTNEKTVLGEVQVCRVTCKPGYHLKKQIPHYELCGAPTVWRWTYELRGKNTAGEICQKGKPAKPLPTACTDPYCVATAAYYMNKIDFTVDPCHNFFDYSCGRWLKEVPYPKASKGRYLTYSIIRNRVKKNMAKLLSLPAKNSDIDAVKKAKVIYKSCMKTHLIDMLDAKPLLKLLKKELSWPVIDKTWTNSKFDFESTYATLRGKFNNNIMFTVKVGKSLGTHVLQTWKGKTTLPYQYYVESRFADRKAAYFSLMKDIAIMLGADKATAHYDMMKVLAFEKQVSLLKSLDIDYLSLKTLAQMKRDLPGVDWVKLFKKMIKSVPVTSSTLVEVWNRNYLADMIKLMAKTDKRVIQNYMVWRLVKHRILNLGRRFEERYLQFKNVMYGTRALHKRWYTCSVYLIYAMKGPTGKMFVDSYFSPAKKKTAEEMFNNIRKAFLYLLKTEVHWMDKKTKAYAKEKALAIVPHIGYNPKIYENTTYLNAEWQQLVVKENDYFGNVLNVLSELSQNSFFKLTQNYNAFAPKGFTVRPTMVNAFYSPSHNTITLPAGEMQYPFYWGDKYPKVFQYGAIGTILGHELTHGFDNNGALRDKYGNLRNWWSSNSWIQFHKRTSCMANQYSNYYWKAAGEFLNGKKTLGENIADNGGIRESFEGYKIYLKSRNMTGEEIEPSTGLTNDQMFFVGFANVRCAKYKHQAAVHNVATSVHSPGRFRVIGSLQNFEKFSKAFSCPHTSYMNPEKKCVIW